MVSLEIDALGRGVFRPGAFFLALDEEIDRFRRFFFLGRRIGRKFFGKCPPADARKAEPEHEDHADDEDTEGVQCAESLNGEKHALMIAETFCHKSPIAGIFSQIFGKIRSKRQAKRHRSV